MSQFPVTVPMLGPPTGTADIFAYIVGKLFNKLNVSK